MFVYVDYASKMEMVNIYPGGIIGVHESTYRRGQVGGFTTGQLQKQTHAG